MNPSATLGSNRSRFATRRRGAGRQSRVARWLVLLLWCVPTLQASAWTEAERARLHEHPGISPAVVEALSHSESASVLIVFDVPEAGDRATRSRSTRHFSGRAGRRMMEERREALVRHLGRHRLRIRHRYAGFNLVAGTITRAGLLRLVDAKGLERIDLDEGGQGSLVEALPLAGFDTVHMWGSTGAGVEVAVLDSGIDRDHPDLASDLISEACFCSGGAGCCPGGGATQTGPGAAEDDNGHGTNVAGVITSTGDIAPIGGAPDARITAVKVLDQSNSFCCTSDVIKALEWVIEERPEVDLVNMSLATNALYAGDCDEASASTMGLAAAVATLRDRGVLAMAATGNGASGTRVAAPACIADVIAVGAVYDSAQGSESFTSCTDTTTTADQVTCFSNSNARTDVFAPGSATTSTGRGGGISTLRGTSQATPLVTACAATLLEAHPGAPPDALELALESSSVRVTDATNGLDFPRLDCPEAQLSLATILDAAATPGFAPWGLATLALLVLSAAARSLLPRA